MAKTKASPTGPGARTRRILGLLRKFESPNVTFIDPDGSWPIVWERARGCHVWDAEGRRYLDLTAAFGVAAAGHAHPEVVRAGKAQMGRLLHAMGDVHPHALKAELARQLSRLTFGRWNRTRGRVIFGNSGFEAVEAALKTARLATGRTGILAFEGGYHGLGYGALNVTHRDHFRNPFRSQLREFGRFVPFPIVEDGLEAPADWGDQIEAALRQHKPGAILVEPIQARGGIRVPPAGFLRRLRELCDASGALLILDEIYTGFGRTGRWFACEHEGVVPDVVCLGKALTGGFPLSACVGRGDLMEQAWPPSGGEAIHTSTYLGHPVGCAMALAQIAVIRKERLPEQAAALGKVLARELNALTSIPRRIVARARGVGLLAGLELRHRDGTAAGAESVGLAKRLLRRGFLLLPEGGEGEVVGFTPPLTLAEQELRRATRALGEELAAH